MVGHHPIAKLLYVGVLGILRRNFSVGDFHHPAFGSCADKLAVLRAQRTLRCRALAFGEAEGAGVARFIIRLPSSSGWAPDDWGSIPKAVPARQMQASPKAPIVPRSNILE